jgi:hypothetical protein
MTAGQVLPEPVVPQLASAGPSPGLALEDQIFAPFIGSWDLVVTWFENGRPKREERGEWHFAWVLGGRAVQDVWIVPPRSEWATHPDPYEYGTSIRFHDAGIGAWRSTWIGPVRGAVHTFLARRIDAEIVLETLKHDGRKMRWIFSDIRRDTFVWRNVVEAGEGWELTQLFRAKRVA